MITFTEIRNLGSYFTNQPGLRFSMPLFLSGFFLVVLALFFLPIPPRLLDFLIATNLFLSLLIFYRALFLEGFSGLTSFPIVLLSATLYRLALNISSTRLILTDGVKGPGAAGQIIESVGFVVVRGDFWVGIILFSIIALVNYLVIARGAARVSEVAARFALDALPGRQMAIDSDRSAGIITAYRASQEREKLDVESRFFGAMDGAMKFVQGDAIAGFLITFINSFAGVGLGISRGMDFSQSVNTFGILTVGDGLVTLIPSLLVAVGAGFVVSRVNNSVGGGYTGLQLFYDPRAVVMAGFALLCLILLPGLPIMPFALVLGVVLIGVRSLRKVESIKRDIGLVGVSGSDRTISCRVSSSLWNAGQYSAECNRLYPAIQREFLNEVGIPLPALELVKDDTVPDGYVSISVGGGAWVRRFADERETTVMVAPQLLRAIGAQLTTYISYPLKGYLLAKVSDRVMSNLPADLCLSSLEVSLQSIKEDYLFFLRNSIGYDDVNNYLSAYETHASFSVNRLRADELCTRGELLLLIRRLLMDGVPLVQGGLILDAIVMALENSDSREFQTDSQSLYFAVRSGVIPLILEALSYAAEPLSVIIVGPEVEDELIQNYEMSEGRMQLSLPSSPVKKILSRDFDRVIRPVIERTSSSLVVVIAEELVSLLAGYIAVTFRVFGRVMVISPKEANSLGIYEVVTVVHRSESPHSIGRKIPQDISSVAGYELGARSDS
ncbi:MAG: FHIPEP family type III secretion protein [bacterium]|nr:FHIPEP family type III secretion protein [bacterium]